MNTKFVIFTLIYTFLLAGIYSSTGTHNLSAIAGRISTCFHTPGSDRKDLELVTCCDADHEGKSVHDAKCTALYLCYKTTTTRCTEIGKGKPQKQIEPNVLTDNGILEQNDNNTTDKITGSDNVKEPKAPKLPEDSGSLVHEGR